MSKLRFAVLVVAVLPGVVAGGPHVALAQAQVQPLGPTPEQRAACQADYDKFCLGTIPGDGRIVACLRRQSDQLSQPCRKMLDSNGK
jgi:hypothetical protein